MYFQLTDVMIRLLRFSVSISVWMTLLLLINSGQALNDDDQDGPLSHRSNNSQSGLMMNQAGRLPISNNNPSSFFRQQSPLLQFGGLPFQQSGIQQNGFPQLNSFQQGGIPQQIGFQQSFPLNSFSQNGFQQPGFQQSNLPQNSFQQNGFQQNGFQQSSFPQNSFQQALPQQQNGLLMGQGSQFNSLGLQNQLLGTQLGLQNQFDGNSFQNQLGIQNPLGFSQNPFGLSLLQQQNQLGLQNQLGFSNQLGIQNQLGVQNPFILQNQLAFQNQLKGQQQNPFSFSQQLGQSAFNSDPQLGSSGLTFGQSNFGNLPQNNVASQFSGTGLGTGSSSSLGSNQVLLQGGQFQDSSSSSGLQFGSQNRFPFGTSSLTNNRFTSNGNGLGDSQQFGSQFTNQFNRDPFLSQRPQLKSPLDNSRQHDRLGRNNGEFFPNDRALNFNNTFDSNSQFQLLQQQPQQQLGMNPFLSQQFLGPFNNQPFAGNTQPLSFNQEQLNRPQFNSFPSALNQQSQKQQQQQPFGSFGTLSTFNNQRPTMNFNNVPLNDQDLGPNQSVMGTSGNTFSDQQIFPPQKPQQEQSLPLPIPMTGFSCEGRPPGYYADVKNECRTFHICIDDGSTSGLKRSFACPNGTLFDQKNSVCQWKEDMDCSRSQLFFPRPAASATSILPNSGDIRPTSSPFNTQIQSPIKNNFPDSTPPTNLFFGAGQPSPAHGSLDAGRSLDDTRRNTDMSQVSPIRSRSTSLFTPPQIRPPLFRPSEQLDDSRKA